MFTGIEESVRDKIKGKIIYNEPMSKHTSFRIGGEADIWIEPQDLDDVKYCIQVSRYKNIPLFIIGGGTNLLVDDLGIRGMVINMLAPPLRKMYCKGSRITATSSVTLRKLVDFARQAGLGGLEFLSGIPGTVGGAVATNAKARHCEDREKWFTIKDFIEDIKSIDFVITQVRFLLTEASKADILSKCQKYLERKRLTQELKLPTAGCIFKNPPDFSKSAGELMDECGLKGFRIGGAEISKKHANFIINTGSACSGDVTALIDLIKNRVRDKFDVELSLEIKIV